MEAGYGGVDDMKRVPPESRALRDEIPALEQWKRNALVEMKCCDESRFEYLAVMVSQCDTKILEAHRIKYNKPKNMQ